ncbi:MAG: [Fe-Fe] hydrogenase large subunit C-terminal domain-containing protein [Chloroflexota bacterium]
MTEAKLLIDLIDNKEKLVAMLAPSFPVVFPYPAIITMLRKLGFGYIVELAVGAKKTNEQLLELLQSDPNARFITSPCPTVVRMVKKIMPQYTKYFTYNVDSPMVATAKIVREKFPDFKPVFIGPCVMKKLEAKEDVPELNILVLTYAELQEVFDHYQILEQSNPDDHFDISEPGMTMMYPVDGGLSHSSGMTNQLSSTDKVKIVSGGKNIEAIKEFDSNPQIRLLDILNCPGGCIGGPGIRSSLSTEERKKKILDYYTSRAQS